MYLSSGVLRPERFSEVSEVQPLKRLSAYQTLEKSSPDKSTSVSAVHERNRAGQIEGATTLPENLACFIWVLQSFHGGTLFRVPPSGPSPELTVSTPLALIVQEHVPHVPLAMGSLALLAGVYVCTPPGMRAPLLYVTPDSLRMSMGNDWTEKDHDPIFRLAREVQSSSPKSVWLLAGAQLERFHIERSSDVRDLQPRKAPIRPEYPMFEVLTCGSLSVLSDVQPANMTYMLLTFEVLSVDISSDVNELQSATRPSMLTTLEVSKPVKSMDVKESE